MISLRLQVGETRLAMEQAFLVVMVENFSPCVPRKSGACMR